MRSKYEKKVIKLISLFIRLTFWNIGYIYQIRKVTTGSWLGVAIDAGI
ncbi:MAG TPA: hypothetical protein V6D28_06195 [Leptolyngbyaceae cyanobacterium]